MSPSQNYLDYSKGLDVDTPLIEGGKTRYINFDNAASTPPFKSVQKAVEDFMVYYSSVHRGTGFKSQLSTHVFEEAREIVLRFVGADPKSHTVAFVKNTTEAINKLARRFPLTEARHVVITSGMEHHSNDLPWRANAEAVHVKILEDGQLDLAEHKAVETRLAVDPDAAARVAAYQEQNSLMQQLFNPILDEPIPEHLTKPVKTKPVIKWKLVANITLLLVGSLIGWISRGSFIPVSVSLASLPQSATVAHAVYAPEVSHPVEVTAEHEAHLIKWLSKRLGKDVHAPDLNRIGFSLIGGRLLPAVDGPAAQFMYENSEGNRMTLYVRQHRDEEKNTAFRFQEKGENKVFYWVDGNLGYALTATIDKQRLLAAANNVYHALSF